MKERIEKKIKNNKSFFKFLVVGGSSTLIDFIIYMIISEWIFISVSKIISMSISSIYSFFVNRKWTFESNDKSVKVKVLYFIAVIINISVNVITNSAVYYILHSKVIAFVIATGTALIVNYLLQKKIVFKGEKNEIFNSDTML